MLKNLFSERTISRIKKEIPDISMLKLFSFGNALIRPCGASIRDEVSKGNFHRTGIDELDNLLKQELRNNDSKYLHTFLKIKNLVGYLSFTEKYNVMQEFVWKKNKAKYEFE